MEAASPQRTGLQFSPQAFYLLLARDTRIERKAFESHRRCPVIVLFFILFLFVREFVGRVECVFG
ncbi:hypothetical protein SLEP1_g9827 [Rubroshorea leprosula]|uniref:Uncharacterized protein n=1 Tax=Rubroshorea leprosula TaxID=152421 RepID=A0AAV5IHG2_9ROSI|nr:hypothetical protein SLEP1_g9827 [Rubroshorea leprosula]